MKTITQTERYSLVDALRLASKKFAAQTEEGYRNDIEVKFLMDEVIPLFHNTKYIENIMDIFFSSRCAEKEIIALALDLLATKIEMPYIVTEHIIDPTSEHYDKAGLVVARFVSRYDATEYAAKLNGVSCNSQCTVSNG